MGGANPSLYSKDDKVIVLFNKQEPNNSKAVGFFSLWFTPTLLGAMGASFLFFTLLLFFIPWFNHRRNKNLKKHGLPVSAIFKSVIINDNINLNGVSPYQIITQWQDPATSDIFIFKSNNLWYDPTDYISTNTFTVYIKENNPNYYFVDTSFLPKRGN